jgi:hypothetical protein
MRCHRRPLVNRSAVAAHEHSPGGVRVHRGATIRAVGHESFIGYTPDLSYPWSRRADSHGFRRRLTWRVEVSDPVPSLRQRLSWRSSAFQPSVRPTRCPEHHGETRTFRAYGPATWACPCNARRTTVNDRS